MGAVAGQYSAGLIVVPDHSMAAVVGADVVDDLVVSVALFSTTIPDSELSTTVFLGLRHVPGRDLDDRVRVGVVAPDLDPEAVRLVVDEVVHDQPVLPLEVEALGAAGSRPRCRGRGCLSSCTESVFGETRTPVPIPERISQPEISMWCVGGGGSDSLLPVGDPDVGRRVQRPALDDEAPRSGSRQRRP